MQRQKARFKDVSLLACLIGLLGYLSGCGRNGSTVSADAAAADAPVVEVMHWLTSKPDAAALAQVRERVIAQGGIWQDSPIGGGETGRAAAVSRIIGGQPPDVFQFSIGSQLAELAAQHLVVPVPLESPEASSAFPEIVRRASQFGGHAIAIPLDIRGENWMFYNVAVLQAVQLAVPHTWPELIEAARQLKAAGKIPIALGGQSWQERVLFNDVLLGIGGRDFYRRVYETLDPNAFSSQVMLDVFRTFAALRPFVDEASPGRRFSEATRMLVHGEAAFQFMGDWAKNQVLEAGLELGRQVGCVLAPASEAAYVVMVDAFAFARTSRPHAREGQELFARVALDPDVQVHLARNIGAIPARSDVSVEGFDICSAHAMEVMRDPNAQLMDPALNLPNGLSGAIDDAISRFWNDPQLSASQGADLLRQAVRTYR